MNIVPPFDDFVLGGYPSGSILQGFKANPDFYWGENGHPGYDLFPMKGGYGKPLKMVCDGVVDYKLDDIHGYQFSIQADLDGDVIHTFVYGHLLPDRPLIAGQHYSKGTICGYMGNSGFVTSGGVKLWNGANPDPNKGGTHLHLGDLPFSKSTGLPLKPQGCTNSGYIDWLPMLEGNSIMKISQDELRLLYNAIFGRDPDTGAAGYIGQDLSFVLSELMKSKEYQADASVLQAVHAFFNVKL